MRNIDELLDECDSVQELQEEINIRIERKQRIQQELNQSPNYREFINERVDYREGETSSVILSDRNDKLMREEYDLDTEIEEIRYAIDALTKGPMYQKRMEQERKWAEERLRRDIKREEYLDLLIEIALQERENRKGAQGNPR